MDVHKGGPAMLISRKACTVVVTLIVTLVTTVSVALAQQGRPDTQAFLVKDIDDSFNTAAGSSPGPFVEAGGTVFFTANDRTSAGLWRTDGTAAGALLVKANSPVPLSASLPTLINIGRTILSTAIQRNPLIHHEANLAYELWKRDGAEAGTVLVKDIVPGPGSSDVT